MMKLPSIRIDKDVLMDLNGAKRLEWIVTNGTGCYASSTVVGMNTRKYHGLLVASKSPPLDRKVLLSKLEEEIEVNDNVFSISVNRYVDIYHPKGYEFLRSFTLDPFPNFTYIVNGVRVKKSIFMPYRRRITVVRYKIDSKRKFVFRIRPFVNFRSIYSLTKSFIPLECEFGNDSIVVRNEDDEYLTISSDKARFVESSLSEEERWYRNFYYEVDASRGEDCVEHNYNPGYFEVKCDKGVEFSIVASFCEEERIDVRKEYETEVKRLKSLLTRFFSINKLPKRDWVKWLVIASDKHVIWRYDGRTSIIAGYHWFGEWGRDSMISLPGLCLSTGRYDDAKRILLTFLEESKDGVIPNYLSWSSGSENAYNSVDAGLWFVNSVYAYYKKTGDLKFIKSIWRKLKDIINAYTNGSISILDNDYLIKHKPGMTWMDVRIGTKFVTPRGGKAVEVQALWYNALRVMELFAKELKDQNAYRTYSFMANKAKQSFIRIFWNGEYLNDTERDRTLRPNQIIALSLPFKVVDDRRKVVKIMECIKKRLLTQRGIRTLEKEHREFRPVYAGSVEERDLAYHQGTIWPWLLGEFVKALPKGERKKFVEKFVSSFVEDEVLRFGLGTISEIIDGDEPFESRGCISQAWSIATIIDAITSL